MKMVCSKWFQHTAARRRLVFDKYGVRVSLLVSTHSRPKAAGSQAALYRLLPDRFNTQPPEGGWQLVLQTETQQVVSTHSRPKAAGCRHRLPRPQKRRFNTQPPEGGWFAHNDVTAFHFLFQHTAARRRLEPLSKALLHQVSQPRFR